MKNLLFCSLSVTLIASVVAAAETRTLRTAVSSAIAPSLLAQSSGSQLPQLLPTPDPAYTPTIESHSVDYPPSPTPENLPLYPVPAQSSTSTAQPLELFSDVRYHGSRNIAPCAVPCIVQIPDPCNKDKCCKTCVNVQICVPPCDPKSVCVTRDGNKIRYDFGKYAVVVKTVGKHVVVNYWD
jgi:hypothetical protein